MKGIESIIKLFHKTNITAGSECFANEIFQTLMGKVIFHKLVEMRERRNTFQLVI